MTIASTQDLDTTTVRLGTMIVCSAGAWKDRETTRGTSSSRRL